MQSQCWTYCLNHDQKLVLVRQYQTWSNVATPLQLHYRVLKSVIATGNPIFYFDITSGSPFKQQSSPVKHCRGDCQFDISGCPAAYGYDDIHQPDMVCTAADYSLTHLPLFDHGPLHLCWVCCDGDDDSAEWGTGYTDSQTADETDEGEGFSDQFAQWGPEWNQGEECLWLSWWCLFNA